MEIAVVILNWNGVRLLEQFLPSIVNFSHKQATIYVADNASTDHSIDYVKTHFPSVNIIQNSENGGYAKGYNDALAKILADVYCLINSDVEVTENWLSPIIKCFKNHKNTAIIQPKILDFNQKTRFEYAGAAGGYIDALAYPYCRGRVFHEIESDHNQYSNEAEIFWASGACLFIRAETYKEVGGLDEDYFAHQEEIDLCWRVKNLGYTINYIGDSVVYHVGGATLNSVNPRKTYLNFRNSLFSIVKNIPTRNLFFILILRLILDGFAGLQFIFTLKPKHMLAIIKAHLSFYVNLPKLIKKRKQVKQIGNYHQHKSIIWQYYVLGRKKFSELR